MSEQEQERPLTRREMRMREQAASETEVSAPEAEELLAEAEAAADLPSVDHSDILVDIDPLNEDGTPRTRREMRELRAAAIAAILAERGEDAAGADDAGDEAAEQRDEADRTVPHREHRPGGDHRPESDDEAAAVSEDADVETDEAEAEAEADQAEAGEVEVDAADADAAEEVVDGAPTEAFTLADLLEASEPTSPTGDAEAVANLFAEDEADATDTDAADTGDDTEPAIVEGEELAVVDDAEDGDEPALTAVIETVDADASVEPAEVEEEIVVVPETTLEASSESVSDVVSDSDSEVDAEADAATDSDEHSTDTGSDTAGYSFPDIQPPEEWRSVFDDPARAAVVGEASSTDSSDFDDLISRAVAQEGSTGGTGASALILPTHPAETGGLSGPLGATGELFVTGSIELPKSLGETGGHAALHDSVEFDAFLTGEHTAALPQVEESGPTPVSALSAVSARRRPEVPVVAEPTKDRSKLPLVLALSGGGLIVVLAGAVIYAASQGVFG